MSIQLAVIGGSGFSDIEEVRIDTPFGAPSDAFVLDTLAGAIVTPPELVPDETKRDLAPILARYVPVGAAR